MPCRSWHRTPKPLGARTSELSFTHKLVGAKFAPDIGDGVELVPGLPGQLQALKPAHAFLALDGFAVVRAHTAPFARQFADVELGLQQPKTASSSAALNRGLWTCSPAMFGRTLLLEIEPSPSSAPRVLKLYAVVSWMASRTQQPLC